jgi:arylsulfatase A-like enzyme
LVASRDADTLTDVVAPSLQALSFNVPGHAVDGVVGSTGSWSREHVQDMYTRRLQSLQAVDRSVAALLRTLKRAGELDDTYVFFTSDNGYLLGEHGVMGKNVLHEQNLRVPLVVAGPDVRAQRSDLPVTLVDLVPTFLQIAGAERRLDGDSVLPTLRGRHQPWRDTQLVQTGHDVPVDVPTSDDRTGGWSFRGVRTERYTFGTSPGTGEQVLFDRVLDPDQMLDLAEEPVYREVVAELQRRTDALVDCTGAACSRRFGPVPSPAVR